MQRAFAESWAPMASPDGSVTIMFSDIEGSTAMRSGGAPIKVRIGIHTGTPVAEGGDYYGTDVDARLSHRRHRAGRRNRCVRELAGGASDVVFGEARELELKGLAGAHTAYAVAIA